MHLILVRANCPEEGWKSETSTTNFNFDHFNSFAFQDIWGPSYWQQLGADITFHICVNLTGFYVRYVSDINMRRGFLDKRGCIETTFRLKYEKEQEENLLLSIIPKHIVAKVGEEVKNFIIKLKDNSEKERMTEKFRFIVNFFKIICNCQSCSLFLTLKVRGTV